MRPTLGEGRRRNGSTDKLKFKVRRLDLLDFNHPRRLSKLLSSQEQRTELQAGPLLLGSAALIRPARIEPQNEKENQPLNSF